MKKITGIRIFKVLLLFSILMNMCLLAYSQHRIRYNDDHLSSVYWCSDKNNGFRISVSLVALFTSGANDRNGLRFGAGIELSQTVDNKWTFSIGADAYKATQRFGVGTSYAGVRFDEGRYGTAYYVNKYYQGDKQVSGIISLHLDEVRINFEDNILAFPFTGFRAYDRYRTAALEVRYKHFILGTNVYTTDINGITDASPHNSRGVYKTGKQISSPVYIGYARNDLILRYGLNNKTGGLVGQNGWHRLFFNTPDFEYGNYHNHFLQVGVDKPYTMF